MSSAESTNGSPKQSPQEEILERVAENFPTWQMGRLIGLDHLNKMLAAGRARANDSHKMQMAKLQEVSGNTMDLENIGDEMSEIRVQGDTVNHIHRSSGMLEKLLPLLLTAGITAGACWYFLKPAPAVPVGTPEANWFLDLEVTDEP